MQTRVLSPLGLHDSFFDSSVARLAAAAERYDSRGHAIPYKVTATPASGELYGSAHDLVRFAMFLMKNRVSGHKSLLDDRLIDEMCKPVFVGPSGAATTFGWFADHLESGAPAIFKSGGQPGVATILYMVPSKNFACAVLANQSGAQELVFSVADQLAGMYISGWQRPRESVGHASSPFVATAAFLGRWKGTLMNGEARMAVALTIETSDATLRLADDKPEAITQMRSVGEALTGNTTGVIASPDAIRARATTLAIKLLPKGDKLVGRVFATAADPNVKGVELPYVLTLERVPDGVSGGLL